MKTSPIHRLSVILIGVVLIFASPVFGDDSTDMLGKALDLVHQVEKPAGNPPTNAQQIDLLAQAIQMAQEAPNHRLKGHRVLAIQAIRSAIAEIRGGDPNHQAAIYLHTADTELSTSVSLAGAGELPAQLPDASASPNPAQPTAAPSSRASQSSTTPTVKNEIFNAARSGDLEKVKALLKGDPTLALSKVDGDMTPLLGAAANDRKDVAEFLLANHADVNARDFTGQTPLAYAAQRGFKDMVELLLANKSDVNAKDNFGKTPLYLAVENRHKDVVEVLLAHQADVKVLGPNGTLLDMAVMSAKTDLVELLLAHGADVNARDKNGDTPLYLAVNSRARDDVAKVLLAHGADANAKGHDGLTPLQAAIKYDDDDMANILRHPELALKDESTSHIDMGTITGVITRLVTNASKKTPGPVEEDVTEEVVHTFAGLNQFSQARSQDAQQSLREDISSDFDTFALEGPLASLYSESSAAIVYGKVKLTKAALEDYKEHPDVSTWETTVGGKVVSTEAGPTLGFVPGISDFIDSKVPDDGQVIASFCLVRQHGHWKVHCIYFSNEPLQGDNKNFIVGQLTAMANKPSPDAIPSGYSILHNFGDGTVSNDGRDPRGTLYQLPGGDALYGVTQDKDNSNSGTIYKITSHGEEMILHVFNGPLPNADGEPCDQATEYPLELSFGGGLQGVTRGGGRYNCGTVFQISQDGDFKTVYEFGNPAIKDGPRGPAAPLKLCPDGNTYGTSDFGGSAQKGTIFRLTPKGVVTTLHSFGDGSVPNDGGSPHGPLVFGPDKNETYYGTASGGPRVKDVPGFKGTLYKTTLAGKMTVLHRFADGSVPNDGNASGKVDLFMTMDNNLYGVTEFGGNSNNSGTFFKFTPKGAVTILHIFGDQTSKDGVWPQPTLVEGGDGNFYGTTAAGGSANEGTIYKITPEGTITILHNFGDGTIPHDGIKPGGGLVLASDGCFYGTTREGGSAANGVVFRIKIP